MATVLITRPFPSAVETAKVWELSGFKTVLAPLLRVQFLSVDLPSFELYQAVITTSAMAVRSLAQLTSCRTMPLWCVGKTSRSVARNLGFEKVFSPSLDAENALSLIECLRSSVDRQKPVLYCCGDRTQVDLPGILMADQIKVDTRVVYQMIPVQTSWSLLQTFLQKPQTLGITFYSQRTVQVFRDFLYHTRLFKIYYDCYPLVLSLKIAENIRPFFKNSPIIGSTTPRLIATLKGQLSEKEENNACSR